MNTRDIVKKIIEDMRPGVLSASNANWEYVTWDSLALDSLDKMETLMQVERMCRVKISDRLAERIDSVADVVRCVDALRIKIPEHMILIDTEKRTQPNTGLYYIKDGNIICKLTHGKCDKIKPTMSIKPYSNMCHVVRCTKYAKYTKQK